MLWPLALILIGIFLLRHHHRRNWTHQRTVHRRAKMVQRMMNKRMGEQEEHSTRRNLHRPGLQLGRSGTAHTRRLASTHRMQLLLRRMWRQTLARHTCQTSIPFRLLFGIPAWTAILLWYHLQIVADTSLQTEKFTAPEVEKAAPLPQEESIDRITIKDGSRIHIIKVEDLLYIQACGDYATLVTSDGEYIKEQTMKNFETHLPADNFVRIHRSSIVNVTQISRVEQYGKETYQVTLKSGVKLRVSLSRYRLLKERLGI